MDNQNAAVANIKGQLKDKEHPTNRAEWRATVDWKERKMCIHLSRE